MGADLLPVALGVSRVSVLITCLALGAALVWHAVRLRSVRALLPHLAIALLIAMHLDDRLQLLWTVAFPLLVATFPDGRFVPRWLRYPVAAYAVFGLVDIVTDGWVTDLPWAPVVNMSTGLLLAAQVYRYMRRATTIERESVRWVIVGTVATVAWFTAVLIAFGEIGETERSLVFTELATLPLLICLVIALVAPRLFAVDPLLHAMIIALVALPSLAVLYAVAGGWLGATLVAVATIPLVLLGRLLADAVVYRGRPSPHRATTSLLRRLGSAESALTVPQLVRDTIVEHLRLDDARISGDWFDAIGDADAATAVRLRIDYRGEELAVVEVPPRRGESALTMRDRAVLDALIAHAAPALHGSRTLAALRESRAQIVVAREEERRRLRRDLHDELGPTLSGVALSAAALARRTGDADADTLAQDLRRAVVHARDIAHGLRPPVLDDHGLIAAIADRTRSTDPTIVRIVAAEGADAALPAAVESAALSIVGEAVTNARTHARASAIDITLRRIDGRLEVEVRDDGMGLPSQVVAGIGMRSIVDRAAEVDGWARYDRTAPGTRLLVSLPTDAAA